jgi:hypothetical protein
MLYANGFGRRCSGERGEHGDGELWGETNVVIRSLGLSVYQLP